MGSHLITVREAQKIILSEIKPRLALNCPLAEAVGRILAETIVSPYPLPFFDNSAMDGFALRSSDTKSASEENPVSLRIVCQIPAGNSRDGPTAGALQTGETAQIFTGAMIPSGADAVVRQEDVFQTDGAIILRGPVKPAQFIRFEGEEIKTGDALLEAGSRLNPAAIGLLAGAGFQEIPVFTQPAAGILVTGSEIVNSADDLRSGNIFDSNSFILSAALREMSLPICFQKTCMDDPDAIRDSIAEGLRKTDFLIVTGGVSVGKFDFVKEAAADLGIEMIFWKVKQKPGKPIFFGASADRTKFLFGLPGNPASALVCFYEYVRPALMRSMGARNPFLALFRAPLQHPFSKPGGLTHYLKSKLLPDGSVQILERQGSHMMSSFAAADCLAVIPEAVTNLQKGDDVEVHLLPS